MSPSAVLRETEERVHFMGVAGAGMVSLAELLLRSGREVSGCDLEPGPAARTLESLGAEILRGHDPSHLEGVGALVVTAAVPSDHPEIVRARETGIPVLKRAEALGEWVSRGRVVGVSGTHGKTTTTAMTTDILEAGGLEPTGFVGGRVQGWESNLRFGGSDLFVVEADEYDRSFHHLHPRVAVVTSVEADHLDVYGDVTAIEDAFGLFLRQVDPDGRVAVCGDDHGASRLLPGLGRRAYTYGLNPGAQLRGTKLTMGPEETTVQVVEEGMDRGRMTLRVPGRHNVLNALGAAAAARALGVGWKAVFDALRDFQGVGRRFQVMGKADGVTVVDDYAHHPTEIRATLAAARARFSGRRIVAVFQPHLYTRTRDFAAEFGEALAGADEVWVAGIYPAREEPIEGVSGVLVAQAVLDAGARHVYFHPELSDLSGELAGSLAPGDVCLTLGAGSIEHLPGDLLSALRSREGEPAAGGKRDRKKRSGGPDHPGGREGAPS